MNGWFIMSIRIMFCKKKKKRGDKVADDKKKRGARGNGTFIERKDGTFIYRKSQGLNPNGKRKYISVVGETKAICVRRMKEKEELLKREKNKICLSDTDTVEELCQRHLAYQIRNKELKPKSIDRREDTIRNQIGKYSLGKMQIQAVKPADIDNHINVLIGTGLSVSTIKKSLDVLNAAYEWAVVRAELTFNPVLQIKRSIQKRLSKLGAKGAADADVIVLSRDEEELFLREALRTNENNGQYKYAGGLYGSLLLHTGMRTGEMISLRWKDYDASNGLLTINKSTSMTRNRNADDDEAKKYVAVQGTTKNQKARVIKLSEEAINDLRRIAETNLGKTDDLICRTKTGKQYTATMLEHCMGTIYKHVKFITKVSGLHIFRRTFATRMFENGADVKEIAAYIGDLESTTMQYYIAARQKMVVGDSVRQVVPLPGSRNVNNEKRDAPAGNKNISE
ncbi:MAG: tyrosine-type recombinase/integrase [Eubacterium sp.]|nr:tyrosine-type recombinase/integrase [Eubacterium sp.]